MGRFTLKINEINQSEKDKYCIVLLARGGVKSSQIYINKVECGYQRGWRKGEKELFHGFRVSDLQDEKSSEDLLHNSVSMLNITELFS